MAMWITCRNYNHYLDKLSFIEKDGMKGNLPFSSAVSFPLLTGDICCDKMYITVEQGGVR